MIRVLVVLAALARVAVADPACQTYLDAYNKAPEDPHNDEVLYNAAVCFQREHSVGVTIQTYQLILKYYPRSKYAALATLGLANAYTAIAFFDRAADLFEQYSRKYAGEKDAADAAHNAIVMRRLSGDDAKAIEDTKYFVSVFGRKLTHEAADAEWALLPIYKKADRTQAIKFVREYIRTYKLDADRRDAVNRELGDLLRTEACPVPLVDGLCVKRSRSKTGCGAFEPVKRDAKLATTVYQAAQDDLWANLGLLDIQLEIAMAAKHGDKDLEARYRDIASNTKDPAAAIAAMARLGQLAEIDDCAGAAKLYADCIGKAVQTSVAGRWVDLCYARAHDLDPKANPSEEIIPALPAPRLELETVRVPELATVPAACKPAAEAFHKVGTPQALVMEAVNLARCDLDAEPPLREALKANGKLYAAQVDFAIVLLGKDPKKLSADIRLAASNALALDPAKPTAHLVLASLALAEKRLDVAAYHIDTALRLDPKLASALLLRGMLSAADGNWTLASIDFKAAAYDPLAVTVAKLHLRTYPVKPVSGPSYEGKVADAIAYRHTSQVDLARKLYEDAIKLAPSRAEAYYDLALLEQSAGDTAKAKDLFAKAHAIDPSL